MPNLAANALSRRTVAALLAALTLLAAACTSARPSRTTEALEAHRQQLFAEMAAGREALSRQVVNRIVREQDAARAAGAADPIVDFLILSGGGDYGAFGAGVLKGWGAVTDPAQAREMLARTQPIGRLITPDEVARVVAMLVDDPGAITGQGINIDGGGVMS